MNNKCVPFLLLLLAFMSKPMSYSMEYPFSHFGSALLVATLPNILPVPSSLMKGRNVGQCWCWGSTSQQWPKHPCVINTLLATNAKHRTVGAAVEKMNSSSARPIEHLSLVLQKQLARSVWPLPECKCWLTKACCCQRKVLGSPCSLLGPQKS